jgi:hypothetical protein
MLHMLAQEDINLGCILGAGGRGSMASAEQQSAIEGARGALKQLREVQRDPIIMPFIVPRITVQTAARKTVHQRCSVTALLYAVTQNSLLH